MKDLKQKLEKIPNLIGMCKVQAQKPKIWFLSEKPWIMSGVRPLLVCKKKTITRKTKSL